MSTHTFKIHNDERVPTFMRTINGRPVRCLYDTGAYVTVWTGTASRFNLTFPSKIHEGTCLLSGFGGDEETAPLYRIPTLEIGAKFYNMHVALKPRKDTDIDIILSGLIFSDETDILILHRKGIRSVIFNTDCDEYNMVKIEGVDTNCIPIPNQSTTLQGKGIDLSVLTPKQLAAVKAQVPKNWIRIYGGEDNAIRAYLLAKKRLRDYKEVK